MKSLQRITKVQLKINYNDEFVLIGIVSAEPDYKLSYILNKNFNISLKNITPVIVRDKNGKELHFSRFSDTGNSSDNYFTLISNRFGKNHLLKKLKNVDYLLKVNDPDININTFTSKLKDIDTVTAIFIIDTDSLKDKNLQYLIH